MTKIELAERGSLSQSRKEKFLGELELRGETLISFLYYLYALILPNISILYHVEYSTKLRIFVLVNRVFGLRKLYREGEKRFIFVPAIWQGAKNLF
jgi:hypothetical protein